MTTDLNYVRFDVGHCLYLCHRSTLEKYSDSVLAKYVAPQFDKRRSGLDYITIDRDGKHFGSILNFMRDSMSLDFERWDDHDLVDLMREADFYCLTELVELCEKELSLRDCEKKKLNNYNSELQAYYIPPNCKIEIVLGLQIGRELLDSAKRSTIVISHPNIRKYAIDSWIEELVRLCDYDKFRVYSISDRSRSGILGDKESNLTLRDFFIALYEPHQDSRFTKWIAAPPYDKFRAKRAHYKCKIFKFWFLIHQDAL